MKTKIGADVCGPICLPDGGGRCWLSAIPACLQITHTLCSQDEVGVRSSSVWTVTPDTRHSDSKLRGTETLSPCVSGTSDRGSDGKGVPQSKGYHKQNFLALFPIRSPVCKGQVKRAQKALELQISSTGNRQHTC